MSGSTFIYTNFFRKEELMKFVHCADIHLDSPFTLTSPEESRRRRTELRSDFSSLVLYAKTSGCELFLISGDLFDDANATKDTFEMLCHEMSSFPSCRFFISPGNHDCYYEKSPYKLINFPENVHVFTSDKLEYVDIPDTNVRIYGYAFTSETKEDSPLAGFSVHDPEKINILVAHADVTTGFSGYCPMHEKDIAQSGFDYVALGHIHKTSGVKYAGNVPYAYPGCLEGRGFDETGYKGALLGDITKEKLDIKSVRFSRRRYEIVSCDITGVQNVSQAAEKIMNACAEYSDDTALRLILEGITSPEFSCDEAVIRNLITKPYYLEIKDNTLPLYNSEYLKNDSTIIGEFYRNIEPMLISDDPQTRDTAKLALKYGLKCLYGRDL